MERPPAAAPRRDRLVTRDVTSSEENIYLFIPNLIGYARIILAVWSLYYMPLHPRRCGILYSISCILDALDGYAARKYDQSTRFGTVLDMVTDRCTTTCLLVFLAIANPEYSFVFQLLICLDLSSHYMHMYATLTMGSRGQSHKSVDKSKSRLMHIYYNNKAVLFILCAANELFYLSLYLLAFSRPSERASSEVWTSSTTAIDPMSAGGMELARANKIDPFIPEQIRNITLVPMLIKQYINVYQMILASQWLAEGDRAERKKRVA